MYIRASVDTTHTYSLIDGRDLDAIAEMAVNGDSRFFKLDSFVFDKDAYYCDNDPGVDIIPELIRFGCQIRDNAVYIPKGLKFSITGYGFTGWIITNNDTDVEFMFLSEEEGGVPISVDFTDLGLKCYYASIGSDRPIRKVLKDISVYMDYFNIS